MTTQESPAVDTISGIISEFTEVMAFSRSRWARFAEDVHPDLSGASMIVLQFIRRKGPITATGLSQMLEMDKSLVSRQVSKLRELGLVESTEAPEDRRVQVITVSADALILLNRVRELWGNAYRERFEGWSADALESLREGLHRFNQAAEDPRVDGPALRCAQHASGDTTGDSASQ